MSVIKYRVAAVKLSDTAKVVDQAFATFAAAARARDYLQGKGYRAAVVPVTSPFSASILPAAPAAPAAR